MVSDQYKYWEEEGEGEVEKEVVVEEEEEEEKEGGKGGRNCGVKRERGNSRKGSGVGGISFY